jgi:hypothetical protein
MIRLTLGLLGVYALGGVAMVFAIGAAAQRQCEVASGFVPPSEAVVIVALWPIFIPMIVSAFAQPSAGS